MSKASVGASNSSVGSSTTTVHHAVTDLLRKFDITTIFGNPGSTELGLFVDFPLDFRYVLGLQESVVVGMADGYAQATHNASFVNLHSAVGVGHAMGAIFTAYKNCTPMIITAGQQSRSILPFDPFLFSAQATELPKPYVKWSIEPARAEDVPQAIARAYYMAMQPPCGPVLVSIPADDWGRECEPVVSIRQISHSIRPDRETLSVIAKQLNQAKHPAFVLGAAVDRDQAWNDAVSLAEKHKAAVWIAPKSGRNSFPENHPLFAGFLPPMRERIVELLSANDFILALGAPTFAYHVEGKGPHIPPGSTLAQIVDDPNTLAWAPVGTAVLGSARQSIRDLLELCHPIARKEPLHRTPTAPAPATSPMTAAYVMQTLARIRDPESVIVEESTSTRSLMQQYLPILRPETFYATSSGGLGFGLAAAVGMALGRPNDKVICLIGDGSSMYSIQALWNAAQSQLPISFLILRNGSYAALRNFAPVYGFKPKDALHGLDLPQLDFVSVAQGLGCHASRVSDPDELPTALTDTLKDNMPAVLEINIA